MLFNIQAQHFLAQKKRGKKFHMSLVTFSKANNSSGSTRNIRQPQFCTHCLTSSPAQTHLLWVQAEVSGVLLPGPHTYQQAASLPDPLSASLPFGHLPSMLQCPSVGGDQFPQRKCAGYICTQQLTKNSNRQCDLTSNLKILKS